MKNLATNSSRYKKQTPTSHLSNGFPQRLALWLLCCVLPLWLGAQVVPQGTFSGNTICPGGQATLTFTASLGTGPFTVRYTDGYAIRTKTGVTSGVPFHAVTGTTATKTYTLLRVAGSDTGVRSSGFTDATATVTVRPRPDLRSLALDPIPPVHPGSDASLKLNGFVQAQSFETQTPVGTSVSGPTSIYAADLDGDGDMDVLSASSGDNKIAWHKNEGSEGFTTQPALNTSADGAASVFAADLDGDGDIDALSGSVYDNKIEWYKNDGAGNFATQPTISTSAIGVQAVYAADLDGDGAIDVLSASSSDDKIAWYKNDGSGVFTVQPAISTSADFAVWVYAADLDGDGNMDVLSTSARDKKIAWYKNNGNGGFTAQPAISTSADGANVVYTADLDGDNDLDVLSALYGDDKIVWYENNGSGGFAAQPAVIALTDGASSVYAEDLDGDGYLDVLATSWLEGKTTWYKNDGTGIFTAQTPLSTTTRYANAVYAADLDGDGDMDVLSASFGNNKIEWYKNRTPFSGNATVTYTAGGGEPQSTTASVSMGMATYTLPAPKAGALAVLKVSNADGCATGFSKTVQLRYLPRPDLQSLVLDPIPPICSGPDAVMKLNGFVQAHSFQGQTPISTTANGAFAVHAADLDGDDDLDVLTSSFEGDEVAWFQNDGSGDFVAQPAISTTTNGATSVYAADLDGDGDLDVLSAAFLGGTIMWYQNNGNGGFTAQAPIGTSVSGAHSVYAADLDGDGDLDVLSASFYKVAWYKNDGGIFTAQTPISTSVSGALSVYAADFDSDGDLDVLSVSRDDDKIAWYKNNGSGDFTEQPAISTSANEPWSVYAADLDGDGDMDALSASNLDAKIAWYKNDGSGSFTEQPAISTSAIGARSVHAADLDGDGDLDVLSASGNNNKIAWYKNNGSGGFTAQTDISTSAGFAFSVHAADLDNDGDLDVLSASYEDDKIAWYKNRTPFSGNASVMYDINGGTPQTASGAVNMGMVALTILVPSAGTLTVTKVANADGCSSVTSKTTPVTLFAPPTFSACPAAPIAVNTIGGQCLAAVAYPVTASGDPAPTLTYAFTGATTGSGSGTGSGSNFNKGSTTVTVTASNTCGLVTCSFIVTVNDTQAPSIACPANIVRNNDMNQCEAVVTYAAPIGSDNCGTPTVALQSAANTASGSAFPVGATTVVWRATDGVNLTATCTFSITVNDTQAPNLTCPANQSLPTASGTCAAVATYSATTSDNCTASPSLQHSYSGATVKALALGNGSGSAFNKGITTVTLRATDGVGLTKTCTFRIIVTDTEAPTMSCPAGLNINASPGQCGAAVTYSTPTYTDNCAPTSGTAVRVSGPASGSTFSVGTTNVVFRATDAASNTRQCTLTVTVTDNQPPTISCPPSLTVTGIGTPCTATVFYAAPTASDNCAGALTPYLLSGLASGSNYPAGTTLNTFRASDPNGMTVECAFSVTVNCGAARPNAVTDRAEEEASEVAPNGVRRYVVSPNPATEAVQIAWTEGDFAPLQVAIFDVQGRLVWERQTSGEAQSLRVEVSDWSAGVYWVALRSADKTETKRLVVVD